MSPLEIAQHYFDLSNASDFAGIEQLFTDTTTYSSPATGIYLGRAAIMAMQRAFHGSFSSLKWDINSITEPKPGITLVDYMFTGQKPNDDPKTATGLEYVVVHGGKIQHIEIRPKL